MARENKLTEGVFTGIVGTRERISSYDLFLETMTGKKGTPELNKWTKKYRDHINKNKQKFQNLAKLEEVIMQLNSKQSVLENIKLSLVREYIYARALFYREGKGTKDIRVIVEKTDIVGDDLNLLAKTPSFIEKAKEKLEAAMDKEIEENIRLIEGIF
jgi:hypothetical protein